MNQETCGACKHWDGNTSFMGGPCRLNGGNRGPWMSCDEFTERMSLSDIVDVIFVSILMSACIAGSVYFTWFLLWRAGYFG